MDKEYMLTQVRERLEQLRHIYKQACNGCAPDGRELTYNGAAVARSKAKKEIGTLKLLETLLLYCADNLFIDEADIMSAFDRLVEPRRIK